MRQATYFDTWTSFQSRAAHNRAPVKPEDVLLSDYRIEATLNADLSLDCVTRVKVKSLLDGANTVTFQMTPGNGVVIGHHRGAASRILQRDSVRSNIGRPDELILVFPQKPLAAGREYEFVFKHSGKVIHRCRRPCSITSRARGNWYPSHITLQFAKYDLAV